MSTCLTSQEIHRYEEEGILTPIPALSSDEASRYLEFANELENAVGEKPKATELAQMHLHFRWAYELAIHPKVLDAVEGVLGPNIIAWATGLFPKHSHDPGFVSWHQDGTYWNLDSTQVTTAWIALSNSHVENGCMRVVPGSQRMEYQPHTETFAEHNALSRGQEIQVEVSEDDALDVILQAGEMSLHHIKIIHGSGPNRCDEKRMGFTIRYISPEVSQHGGHGKAILARGEDHFGHYEFVGPPPKKSFSDALAAMKESAGSHLNSVMQDGK